MANWANVATLGDPLSPGWQQQNLTWIEPVPGQRWQVYAPAAPAFEGLLKDLIARGYSPTSSGGFNYRNIRGSDRLSQHAFGTAIDLNSMTNQLGSRVSDIPDAANLAKKWGLEWGGNWQGRPDPMHFEYTGGGGSSPAPASGGGGIGTMMAGAVDPRAAVMAQLEDNPFKVITDAAAKRGGLAGEGSAGGGLSVHADADPGIPPLETAAVRLTPDALGAQASPRMPGNQLRQLEELFKVKPIGQAGQIGGQALPLTRRA